MRHLFNLRLLFALPALAATLSVQAATYTITNLPYKADIEQGKGTLNNFGDIATGQVAYIGGKINARPDFGYYARPYVVALNDSGTYAGDALDDEYNSRGFYTVNGQTTMLGSFNTWWSVSHVSALNNQGLGTGSANTNHIISSDPWGQTFAMHAFRTDGKTLIDLGTLGGLSSNGTAINNRGEVVGWSEIATDKSQTHGFVYSRGQMIDLGQIGSLSSKAVDINDAGLIIGNAGEDSTERAFIYQNGITTMIDTPAGYSSRVKAVNQSGLIIGSMAQRSGGRDHFSFIYVNGQVVNLDTLLAPSESDWRVFSAYDINDRGQILAETCSRSVASNCKTVILSPDQLLPMPVPEPGTYAMLLAGLGILGWVSRRRVN